MKERSKLENSKSFLKHDHTEKNTKKHIINISLMIIHMIVIMLIVMFGVFMASKYNLEKFTKAIVETKSFNNLIFVLLAVIFISMASYIYLEKEFEFFTKSRQNINLYFTIIEISLIVSLIVGEYFNAYARPFALSALLGLTLINKRTALFMNSIFTILMLVIDLYIIGASGVTDFNIYYCIAVIGFSTNILAIYLVAGITSRLVVLLMGIVLALPIILFSGISNLELALARPLWVIFYGAVSGVLSVQLMMIITPIYENIFNLVTDFRLAELTDSNNAFIKKLRESASGTYNHSLILATLTESCASAIGENPVLARACAYYHDVGKLVNPSYFTENQIGVNPHDELLPEVSTDIIRSHAKDGHDYILKYNLPKILADVALEHHGTMPIRYFYAKALKYTEGNLNVENFSYAGPKPQSKMSAIVMICDASEAVVRAMGDRRQESVDRAVKDIIEERMELEQFDECPLTLKDINVIRQTITESLSGVHHGRVKYPKINYQKKQQNINGD